MSDTKKCPFCAEEIKLDAIVCRYCGRDLPVVASGEMLLKNNSGTELAAGTVVIRDPNMPDAVTLPPTPNPPEKEKVSWALWSLLGVSVLFVVGVVIVVLSNTSRPGPVVKAREPMEYAVEACRIAMTNSLKAPSTAKFPDDSTVKVSPGGGFNFLITSYVDAQNSFGAMIRTEYTCVLVNPTGNTWNVTSLTTP